MGIELTRDERTVFEALPMDYSPGYLINLEVASKIGMDPNTCASRLSSLQYKGVAVSRWRSGVRKKEWAQRSEPVAPRMKVPAPKFRVAAVEPVLIGSMERVIIEAPKGVLQPGMELRQA
jgi:hypothetical protein